MQYCVGKRKQELLMSHLTLSFWPHQNQVCHETSLQKISSEQGAEAQGCYKSQEDMPHQNHPCVCPREL